MNIGMIVAISCGVLFGLAPILLRSSAVAIFLTLCAGMVASKLVAQDVTQIVNSVVSSNLPTYSIVQITLLVAGPVVLLLGLKGSSKASGIIWQIIPAASAAILAVYFIAPMLTYEAQKSLQESQAYGYIQPYFGLAAAAGLLASVLHLWAQKPKKHDDKHGKKHKK